MHVDAVPEPGVPVRPVGVVQVAGVDPAVPEPGRLDEELGDGAGPGHHDGAHTTPGAGELYPLPRSSVSEADRVGNIYLFSTLSVGFT